MTSEILKVKVKMNQVFRHQNIDAKKCISLTGPNICNCLPFLYGIKVTVLEGSHGIDVQNIMMLYPETYPKRFVLGEKASTINQSKGYIKEWNTVTGRSRYSTNQLFIFLHLYIPSTKKSQIECVPMSIRDKNVDYGFDPIPNGEYTCMINLVFENNSHTQKIVEQPLGIGEQDTPILHTIGSMRPAEIAYMELAFKLGRQPLDNELIELNGVFPVMPTQQPQTGTVSSFFKAKLTHTSDLEAVSLIHYDGYLIVSTTGEEIWFLVICDESSSDAFVDIKIITLGDEEYPVMAMIAFHDVLYTVTKNGSLHAYSMITRTKIKVVNSSNTVGDYSNSDEDSKSDEDIVKGWQICVMCFNKIIILIVGGTDRRISLHLIRDQQWDNGSPIRVVTELVGSLAHQHPILFHLVYQSKTMLVTASAKLVAAAEDMSIVILPLELWCNALEQCLKNTDARLSLELVPVLPPAIVLHPYHKRGITGLAYLKGNLYSISHDGGMFMYDIRTANIKFSTHLPLVKPGTQVNYWFVDTDVTKTLYEATPEKIQRLLATVNTEKDPQQSSSKSYMSQRSVLNVPHSSHAFLHPQGSPHGPCAMKMLPVGQSRAFSVWTTRCHEDPLAKVRITSEYHSPLCISANNQLVIGTSSSDLQIYNPPMVNERKGPKEVVERNTIHYAMTLQQPHKSEVKSICSFDNCTWSLSCKPKEGTEELEGTEEFETTLAKHNMVITSPMIPTKNWLSAADPKMNYGSYAKKVADIGYEWRNTPNLNDKDFIVGDKKVTQMPQASWDIMSQFCGDITCVKLMSCSRLAANMGKWSLYYNSILPLMESESCPYWRRLERSSSDSSEVSSNTSMQSSMRVRDPLGTHKRVQQRWLYTHNPNSKRQHIETAPIQIHEVPGCLEYIVGYNCFKLGMIVHIASIIQRTINMGVTDQYVDVTAAAMLFIIPEFCAKLSMILAATKSPTLAADSDLMKFYSLVKTYFKECPLPVTANSTKCELYATMEDNPHLIELDGKEVGTQFQSNIYIIGSRCLLEAIEHSKNVSHAFVLNVSLSPDHSMKKVRIIYSDEKSIRDFSAVAEPDVKISIVIPPPSNYIVVSFDDNLITIEEISRNLEPFF